MGGGELDLGHGVKITFFSWADHEKAGLFYRHPRPDGKMCESGVYFDVPGMRETVPERAVWTVESWEPLTLSPSLLCTACGHHGFVRAGKWVPA